MLKQLLTVVLCLSALLIKAQNFAPVTATWTYKCMGVFEGDTILYNKIIGCYSNCIVYDSIANRTVAKILDDGKTYYIYESSSGDTIFWRLPQSQYSILYNFNAAPGDTWVTNVSTPFLNSLADPITIYVDSTGYEIINNDTLRTLYVRNKYPSICGFGLTVDNMDVIKVYEKLGAETFLIPKYYYPEKIAAPRKLCCYSDCSYFGIWHAPDEPSCYPFFTTVNEENKTTFSAYPNPTSNTVTIDLPATLNTATLQIVTVNGQLIETHTIANKAVVDMSNYVNGLYVFKLTDTGNMVNIRRVAVIH